MRLSRPAAFYLQASIILFFLAASSAATPLYAVYQAAWGFSPVTTTIIFGIYAVAVLLALLVVGSLSDYLGRRPVLVVAAALQTVAMVVFITADGVGALLAARAIQGLSTGAAAGAVGAGLLDLDRARGTIANAVAPLLGTATGGLLSGLLAQYLPAPTTLVYAVLAAIFVLQIAGLAVMPETVTPRPGALASLRPQLRLPPQLRAAMLVAAPALIAAWALVGFYGALGPALLRHLLATRSLAVGGVALFVLAVSGALAVLATRTRPARAVLGVGTAALAAGVALTLLALSLHSAGVFFAGLAVAGAGFGASFQGAIRTVVPFAAPHERAGVLSVVYIVAYLAMGVPAVLGGLRSVQVGLVPAAHDYAVAIMVLAGLALLGALRPAIAALAHVRRPARVAE
jgi:MFS family permease